MTNDDVWATYVALWQRAQSQGVWIHYQGHTFNGEAGYFHSRHDFDRRLSPMIAIIRPYYREPMEQPSKTSNAPIDFPQPDLRSELVTLAHEYGHFCSYNGRTARDEWDRYYATARRRTNVTDAANEEDVDPREALRQQLDDGDRDRIVREETLAWTIGREVLAELGADEEFLACYDARTRIGLHNHRYRLGIDELWPEDAMSH